MATATVFRMSRHATRYDYIAEVNNVYFWCELRDQHASQSVDISNPLVPGVVRVTAPPDSLVLENVYCTYPVVLIEGCWARVGDVEYKNMGAPNGNSNDF